MAFLLQISTMNQILQSSTVNQIVGQVSGKHGVFKFFNNDIYVGSSLREYGEFSEIEYSMMEKFVQDGDTVIDVGANIGCFTVPLAKKVGFTGRVIAFEPQLKIYDLLNDNLELNNLKNARVYNAGLGEEESTTELGYFDYSKIGNFGGICINNHYDNNDSAELENKKKYKVGVITLDTLLDIEKCNFIKIDAECMELDILKGGIKFIEKFRPIMWVENHDEFPNKLNKYLLNINYNLYWMYTLYYNKNNYFTNDINHFGELATLNVLAIPKENKKYCIDDCFDKIFNENTKYTQCFRATF